MVTFRRRRKWPGPAPPDPAPPDPAPPSNLVPSGPDPASVREPAPPPPPELPPTFMAVFKDAIQDTPRTIRFGFILAIIFLGFVTVLQAAKGIHLHLAALGFHLHGLNYVIAASAVGGATLGSFTGMLIKKLIKAWKGLASNDED
jgi:hypothetical protein